MCVRMGERKGVCEREGERGYGRSESHRRLLLGSTSGPDVAREHRESAIRVVRQGQDLAPGGTHMLL